MIYLIFIMLPVILLGAISNPPLLLKTEDTRLDSLEKVVWSEEDSALDHFKKASASERSKIVKSKMRLLLSQSSAARSPEGEANQYLRVKEVLKSLSAFFRYLYPSLNAESFTNAEQPGIWVQTEKEFKPLSQDELDRAENMEKSFLCVNKVYKFQHKLPGEDELSMILGIAVMPVSEYCEKRVRSELLLERLEAEIKKCAKPGESGMLKKEMNLLFQIGILFPHFEEKKENAVKAWKARMSAFKSVKSVKIREGLVARGDLNGLMETMDIITEQRRAQCHEYMAKILSNVKPLGNKSEREAQFRVMRGAIDGMIAFFRELYNIGHDEWLDLFVYDECWKQRGDAFELCQDALGEKTLCIKEIRKYKQGSDHLLAISAIPCAVCREKDMQCGALLNSWQAEIKKSFSHPDIMKVRIRTFLHIGAMFPYCLKDKDYIARECKMRLSEQKKLELRVSPKTVSNAIKEMCLQKMSAILSRLSKNDQDLTAIMDELKSVEKLLAVNEIQDSGIVAQAQEVSSTISGRFAGERGFDDLIEEAQSIAAFIVRSCSEDDYEDMVMPTGKPSLPQPMHGVGMSRGKPSLPQPIHGVGMSRGKPSLPQPMHGVGMSRSCEQGSSSEFMHDAWEIARQEGIYWDVGAPKQRSSSELGVHDARKAVCQERMSWSMQALPSQQDDSSESVDSVSYDMNNMKKMCKIYVDCITSKLYCQKNEKIAQNNFVVAQTFHNMMDLFQGRYALPESDCLDIFTCPKLWERKDKNTDLSLIQGKTLAGREAFRVFIISKFNCKDKEYSFLDIAVIPNDTASHKEFLWEQIVLKFDSAIQTLYDQAFRASQEDHTQAPKKSQSDAPPRKASMSAVLSSKPKKYQSDAPPRKASMSAVLSSEPKKSQSDAPPRKASMSAVLSSAWRRSKANPGYVSVIQALRGCWRLVNILPFLEQSEDKDAVEALWYKRFQRHQINFKSKTDHQKIYLSLHQNLSECVQKR